MLLSLLKGLKKVNIADDETAWQAIYRLRYRVYVDELKKKNIKHLDVENKILIEPEDTLPGVTLFYTGKKENPTATFRINIYDYDDAPSNVRERFSLDIFPEFKGKKIVELGRWIIDPAHRGSLLMLSMVVQVYKSCIEQKVDLAFLYCAPGMARLYKRFGYRPYAGKLVPTEDGLRIPMIFILSDVNFLRQAKSPLTSIGRRHYGKGRGDVLDIAAVKDRLGDGAAPFKVGEKAIWSSLEEEFVRTQKEQNVIFDNISDEEMRLLSKRGVLIDVPTGEAVLNEGLVEREMFIIIKGTFEVKSKEGQHIAFLGQGEVFGEMAFFSNDGVRTASVTSCEDGSVLMLRRKFIDELMVKDAPLAAKLLLNISRILAGRCATMLA